MEEIKQNQFEQKMALWQEMHLLLALPCLALRFASLRFFC
jgi:hypothetical protein